MPERATPVMIFGAGFGTRMRELTQSTPKPLIKISEKPLIDHAIGLTKNRDVVVNTHYLADQMEAHLSAHPDVQTSSEQPEILDTGGGLRHALPLLKSDTVFTLNSDAIWSGPNPLDLLETAWDPDRMDALLLLVPLTQTVGFSRPGDFKIDSSDRLHRDPDGLVYTGAQILKTELLQTINETHFSLNLLWNLMAEKQKLCGLKYPGRWADVGTPEGIPLAEKLLEARDV